MKTIIDIGTNTILMLIADFDRSASKIKTILDIQEIPRLGKSVDSNRNILPESFEKAVDIINRYNKISYEHSSKEILAVATSFIRDSNNKFDFLNEVKSKTGIDVEILSGEDEARWSYWGAYDKYQRAKRKEQIIKDKKQMNVIDIGGGSTEITTGKDIPDNINYNILRRHPIESKSINIGSMRIKERYLQSQPPSRGKIKAAEKFIEDEFDSHLSDDLRSFDESELIGVAGTITTLGAIKLGLKKFKKDKIDNIELSAEEIENIFNVLSGYNIEKLLSIGDYMYGRADIICSGVLILKTFMRKFGFDKIIVSTKGLRYGIFLREEIR